MSSLKTGVFKDVYVVWGGGKQRLIRRMSRCFVPCFGQGFVGIWGHKGMVTIEEKTVLHAPPEKVWDFLTRLHQGDNYHRWHPKDHIRHWVEKGDMRTVGPEAYYEEGVGKHFELDLWFKLIDKLRKHYD